MGEKFTEYRIISSKDVSKWAIEEFLSGYGCRPSGGGVTLAFVESDCLSIEYADGKAVIGYGEKAEIFRALLILIESFDGSPFRREEKRRLKNLSFMADNSRNAVLNLPTVRRLIRVLAAAGYNELQLYTEDTYEIAGEPYFGYLRGRYTAEELRGIDAYADAFGIEVVPCIQTLAHLNAIARWPEYRGIIDCNDILLAGEEKTYALIDKMFATYAACLKSRKINIGMDEAHMVGLGEYFKRNGHRNRFDIMNEHLKRVLALADKYGYKPAMWSDMYFRLAFDGEYHCTDGEMPQAVVDSVPQGVDLIYWDYDHLDSAHYAKMIDQHKRFERNKTLVAGGVWKWMGFAPDNRYSMAANKAAAAACLEKGIGDFILTAWGDDGAECSVFAALPCIVACGEHAYGRFDDADIAVAFTRITGCELADFLSVDLPNRQNREFLPEQKNNSSRYLLYNDCFLGIFDCFAAETREDIMRENLSRIKSAHKTCGEFAYVFDTLAALQEVNIIKARLGLDTRRAYRNNDRPALIALLDRYAAAIAAIERLYAAFRTQWLTDNKPEGFEVQDIRLGGLLRRVTHCAERLKDYIEGRLAKIGELETDTLPLPEGADIHTFVFQSYLRNVSACVM